MNYFPLGRRDLYQFHAPLRFYYDAAGVKQVNQFLIFYLVVG